MSTLANRLWGSKIKSESHDASLLVAVDKGFNVVQNSPNAEQII